MPPTLSLTDTQRECLSLLAKRHAYVQCTETMKPKQLLCSIYSQLYGYKRKKVEGYAGLNVESLADFFKILPGKFFLNLKTACYDPRASLILSTLPSLASDVCLPGKPTSLIVLDDAHWLSRMPQLLRPLLQVTCTHINLFSDVVNKWVDILVHTQGHTFRQRLLSSSDRPKKRGCTSST